MIGRPIPRAKNRDNHRAVFSAKSNHLMAQKHWQKKFGQVGDTLESEGMAMIEIAQVVLAIYGILLIVGGIIGKAKSGSSASLFAGAICGIAALMLDTGKA